MAQSKIASYLRKCLAVLPAVPICALGVAIFLKAGQGTDPLTMFEVGLSQTFHTTLGTASFTFEGSMFVLFFFLNRKLVNFGSFAFCFGIGPCIDFFTPFVNNLFPVHSTIPMIILEILIGTILVCASLAYYIPMDFGYQTSDIFTLSIAEWFHLSYRVSLTIVYAILFSAAWFLHGPWGVGTLVAIFLYGPVIQALMKLTSPFSLAISGTQASLVDKLQSK